MPTSRATRVTSEVNTPSCWIIVLTIVAERRNSPSSGRPSTSSRTVWSRSPLATAARARVTSVVGQSRSSISVLTEVSISPQAPARSAELDTLARLALAADHRADAFELAGHPRVGGDDVVDGVGDLAVEAGPVARQPDREVALSHRLEHMQQFGHASLVTRQSTLVRSPVGRL